MQTTGAVQQAIPAHENWAQAPERSVAPLQLDGLLPRRERPRLLVLVDGAAESRRDLVWSLREAARREGTVLAVALIDSSASEGRRSRTLATLDAEVLRAIGETGVHGRSRTALLDPLVYEALAGTARGGDLVVVRPHGKAVLRTAVPRRPSRRAVRVA